jgi:hypothetical protein
MELVIAFVVGLVVMDTMWAWRLGIIKHLWYRFKNRNNPQPELDQE